MDNKYCYEGTDILKNKLNIKNDEKLYEVERKLTALRTKDLYKKPVKGDFDLEHLKKIHKHIFQDIYEWAGEIRDVDIAKSNLFCLTQYIDTFANEIFTGLKKENHLKDLDKEEFSKRCAYYFCEINALHPFREGNGRSQREFIRELALNAGYIIDWSKLEADEMLEASIYSFNEDNSKMEKLFYKIIVER